MTRNNILLLEDRLMVRIRKILAAFVIYSIISLLPVYAIYAGDQSYVEVEGHATIVMSNKDAAREIALNDAFRRAVEQAVGVMVESNTLVSNLELLSDRIYSKSAGFIKKYSIISERIEEDSCRIRIKALVSKIKLEKGLDSIGVLSKRMGKPRLIVFLSEQNADQKAPSYWWRGEVADSTGIAENALMTRCTQKGFEFVDRQLVFATIKDEQAPSGLGASLSNESALKLLADGEAEVAIIGQAVARQGATTIAGTNIRSCQASVTARAVNTDNGELLASVTSNAVVAHMNPAAGGAEALKKAAEEAAEKLMGQITSKWKERVNRHRTLKLIITGISFDDVAVVKDMLKEKLDEVDEIYDRSFTAGTAKLDMDINSSAHEVARELNNLKFRGGTLEITSVTANVVQLKMTAR